MDLDRTRAHFADACRRIPSGDKTRTHAGRVESGRANSLAERSCSLVYLWSNSPSCAPRTTKRTTKRPDASREPHACCPHVNKARRMKASHPCGAVFLSRRPSLCSDLDHFEVFLACAAFGTRPVDWNVFPASTRRNSFLGQSRFFVINPATNQAHPASVFHTYVASGNRLNECMMVPVWRRDA
jgi:hypothetical protein